MKPSLTRAQALHTLPFFDLIHESHQVHRRHHDPLDIQKCSLLSIKTGGCPEDCSYCPQSAHYRTSVERHDLLTTEKVRAAVRKAKADGASRFCIGAAWRSPKTGDSFNQVLEMVRAIKAEGLEACATLGMLTDEQAHLLKASGLDAYNHNLDTSRGHYDKIIRTRTFDDRLATLSSARKAGIQLCCGGILGMGESDTDRLALLAELASMNPPPESVPINLLIPVEGTPLAKQPPVDPLELVRLVAIARILMPKSRIRLSAGRLSLSREAQILAFFAGANSIFLGDRLLTRENPAIEDDEALLRALQGGKAHDTAS